MRIADLIEAVEREGGAAVVMVAEPITPRKPNSPRSSTAAIISRSSAWLWVSTTCSASPGAALASASGNGVSTVSTPAGISAGKPSSRASTQRTAKGRGASARASAVPTWPPP